MRRFLVIHNAFILPKCAESITFDPVGTTKLNGRAMMKCGCHLILTNVHSLFLIMTRLFLSMFIYAIYSHNVLACTNEFAPVCGYWMHTPKTQTFTNVCQMQAAGAKIRHQGSCADQSPKKPSTTLSADKK